MADYTLMLGDCLELMKNIPDGSVDAVITDPPYGTTACAWDSVIQLDDMWASIRAITEPSVPIVLFAGQPFTSALIMSNPAQFKYCWVYDKVNLYTNQMMSSYRPMTQHEDIAVFGKGTITYTPQKRRGKPYNAIRSGTIGVYAIDRGNGINADGLMHPGTIISIPARNPHEQGLHPTQKPVALLEYLVKTYTNPGDTVLDFTMGSGTTGVACGHLGRKFIGIEIDPDYYAIAERRIRDAYDMADGKFRTLNGSQSDVDSLPLFGGSVQ